MIARLTGFECAGYGPSVTRSDRVKNTAVNVGGTLILSLVWLSMMWLSKHNDFRGQAYLWAASPMAYVLPYLIGLRYTSLKGRSAAGQAISILSAIAVVMAILMAAGWITTKI